MRDGANRKVFPLLAVTPDASFMVSSIYRTGDIELLIAKTWNQLPHQDFLHVIRGHWRGWQIVLFEDRGSPHTAKDSQAYAASVGIQLRFLPCATPELNAMDQLWRRTKGPTLANCTASMMCLHSRRVNTTLT
jgi:hypothetical protein